MKTELFKCNLSKVEANQYNPLVLAFIGDAVFEVFVRTHLVMESKELSAHKLHVKAISYVKAHAQSEFIHGIENELSEEERAIFKRGRNAKSPTVPKNADVQEYRAATGFEALLGYLYLCGEEERLDYFLNKVLELHNSNEK